MQSAELVALELSVALFIAHVLAQVLTQTGELGHDYLMSARDESRGTTSALAGRAKRALDNFLENYTPFVALDLALVATGRTGGLGAFGAVLWITARIVYLPIYLVGVPYVRTGCWALGVIALLIMLARLAGL
ncbi:MAG: MAPEG family protein [Methylovirgula sp.]